MPCLNNFHNLSERKKFNFEQIFRILELCGYPEDLKFIEAPKMIEFMEQVKPYVKYEGFEKFYSQAQSVTSDDIAFLRKMLEFDPRRRATIYDLVNHP